MSDGSPVSRCRSPCQFQQPPEADSIGRATAKPLASPIRWSPAGDGAVVGLGRPVADHHHGSGESLLPLVGAPVWFAVGAPGPQCPGQFATQFTAALNVEGLVDRLVGHVHLRPVREGGEQ